MLEHKVCPSRLPCFEKKLSILHKEGGASKTILDRRKRCAVWKHIPTHSLQMKIRRVHVSGPQYMLLSLDDGQPEYILKWANTLRS